MSTDNQEQIKALTKVLNTWQRKRVFLKDGFASSNSPQEKFSLQESINECEQEIERITEEIHDLRDSTLTTTENKLEPEVQGNRIKINK